MYSDASLRRCVRQRLEYFESTFSEILAFFESERLKESIF